MLFSVLVHCQKRGVRSVADHAILRPGCLQETGRLQPEFAVSVRRPDMDMGRLTSLVGVEVKTERSDAQSIRHGFIIPRAKLHRNIFANVPKLSDSRTCSLQRMFILCFSRRSPSTYWWIKRNPSLPLEFSFFYEFQSKITHVYAYTASISSGIFSCDHQR